MCAVGGESIRYLCVRLPFHPTRSEGGQLRSPTDRSHELSLLMSVRPQSLGVYLMPPSPPSSHPSTRPTYLMTPSSLRVVAS